MNNSHFNLHLPFTIFLIIIYGFLRINDTVQYDFFRFIDQGIWWHHQMKFGHTCFDFHFSVHLSLSLYVCVSIHFVFSILQEIQFYSSYASVRSLHSVSQVIKTCSLSSIFLSLSASVWIMMFWIWLLFYNYVLQVVSNAFKKSRYWINYRSFV